MLVPRSGWSNAPKGVHLAPATFNPTPSGPLKREKPIDGAREKRTLVVDAEANGPSFVRVSLGSRRSPGHSPVRPAARRKDGGNMSRLLRLAALAAVIFCIPMTAAAQALQSFSGGSLFATYQADGDTVGWRFSVDRSIIVTHLGFWDGEQDMTLDHPVGIWDAAGTLLGSNIVSPGSPLTGQFRYEEVGPIVLPAGTYNLGAFYSASNPTTDGYMTGATNIVMAPGFTMLNTLRDPDGAQTGLVFPSVTSAAGGRFGPNILFTEVPEPTTAAAVFGLGALAALRRRVR